MRRNYHPLHIDPETAAKVGLPVPLLHGLCTYGFAVRHILKHFAENHASRLHSTFVRFVAPVFPGETLRSEMWAVGNGHILFQTLVPERNSLVLKGSAHIRPADTVASHL